MLGADESHAAVPWFWSDQHETSLFIAGLGDEGRSVVRRDLGGGAFILFHLAGDGRLVAASGIGQGNTVARDIRLAGDADRQTGAARSFGARFGRHEAQANAGRLTRSGAVWQALDRLLRGQFQFRTV